MVVTAKVAVNRATFQFDKLYSYAIPAELLPFVQVGSMVLVPFGKNNAARMGVVLEIEEQPAQPLPKNMKSLYDCAREECVLTGELLKLVYFLKQKTFCTYYDAVKAIIPYGAQYKPIGHTLQKQLTRTTDVYYAYQKAGEKLTVKQQLVSAFLMGKQATFAEISEAVGVGKTVVDGLVKKGGAKMVLQDKSATIYANYTTETDKVVLSPEQAAVFTEIEKLLFTGKREAGLLHGVTGSGKTLIFLKLIEQTLAQKKQALILVPEISLTPQMVYRLKETFGERVAVQHSALSNTERLLQWQQIQKGQADVVVGTRSGVFAPLQNIGLIVIDEEQESTYHSDQSPRYSAHDIARFRAEKHKALLLLSSATPSVESYYRTQKGNYHLFQLHNRYGNNALPEAHIVDMRNELQNGNAGAISIALAEELANNLANGEQSIILLNRRGYQTIGMCTACGEVIKCTQCSVPMVYHKKDNKLLCHYCGKTITPAPQKCEFCAEPIKYTGLGTQKVEEELAALFPAARILRMDLDSTSKKSAHESMLKEFRDKKYDILVGTQMVAKGLDFPLVTLVGVIGIDQLLFSQSYKAYERVFSLVTQVIGRSGRSDLPGRALVQTLDPANRILHLAAQQNYRQFYEEEISFRKLHLYPPFCNLCLIGFQGTDENKTRIAAVTFLQYLQTEFPKDGNIPIRVLGPAPYPVVLVKGRFRYKLTLKCKNDKKFRDALTKAMLAFGEDNASNAIQLVIDFNQDSDI